MLLELCTVSRKTPLDGKLEISPATASRLSVLGEEFTLRSAGREGPARLAELECTCAKASAGRHVHHFVQSELLRALAPGAAVRVELADPGAGVLHVEPAPGSAT
jgi:hypothetical protein